MTNKIVLRSIEEFMQDYVPNYAPILPLFLGKSQAYTPEVGELVFKRIDTVGDIRSKVISPKATAMHAINATETSKKFNKYFYGSKYVQSKLQDARGYEEVLAQVLDEHNKQSDITFLTGDGTSDADVLNNGLFWSNDANYVKNSSAAIPAAGNNLPGLYSKMLSIFEDANVVSGRKLIMPYGTTVIDKVNSLFDDNSVPFLKAVSEALPGVAITKMPREVTPAGQNGFLVINMDQIKLHYTVLPGIDNQGQNDEDGYAWTNFLMGSSMLEVLARFGIVKQPITFTAP